MVVQPNLNRVRTLLSIDNLGQRQFKLLTSPEPEGQAVLRYEDVVNETRRCVYLTSCDDVNLYWVGRGAGAVDVVVIEHNAVRVSADSRVTCKSVISNRDSV